ncbi:MAG: LamG domain-containing protein, partial [Candidatus Pacebacteria bacterium]|nr:LamG domain-containing protein [Candidatus Paceibacterota bacterium]
GGIPPSDPSGLSISSTTNSFTLSFTKGSSSNTVIRRSINTAPTNQEEGTAVYNSTGSSFTDSDPTLTKNTTYCYSIWSYNPSTAALSTSHISGCGTLSNMASPTNLTFPTVAYNSIILNWTTGTGSTKTYIVRKPGSIPANKDDGTVVYNDSGNAFIDTGLTDNTQYCYTLYATDGTEYTEPVTGCQTTQTISGLVSYWKFDEESGTAAYDSAGLNNGTLINGPVWKNSTDCISGNCLQFDGNNDYVNIPDSSSLRVSTFTISAWIKTSNLLDQTVFIKPYNANTWKSYRLCFSDKIVSELAVGTPNSYPWWTTNSIITAGTWHHIAITRNNAGNSSDLSTYFDGVLVPITYTANSYSSSNKTIVYSNMPAQIGRSNAYATPTAYMNGLIDEVKLYNRVLSVEEIYSLYSIGVD